MGIELKISQILCVFCIFGIPSILSEVDTFNVESECPGTLLCSNLLGPIKNIKNLLNQVELMINARCKRARDVLESGPLGNLENTKYRLNPQMQTLSNYFPWMGDYNPYLNGNQGSIKPIIPNSQNNPIINRFTPNNPINPNRPIINPNDPISINPFNPNNQNSSPINPNNLSINPFNANNLMPSAFQNQNPDWINSLTLEKSRIGTKHRKRKPCSKRFQKSMYPDIDFTRRQMTNKEDTSKEGEIENLKEDTTDKNDD